jgi:hypothetical protein
MTDATAEIMWVQSVLHELQVSGSRCARLWCDNMGTKYLTSNPIFHRHIKHVKVDYHFIRNRVLQRLLDIQFISTAIK